MNSHGEKSYWLFFITQSKYNKVLKTWKFKKKYLFLRWSLHRGNGKIKLSNRISRRIRIYMKNCFSLYIRGSDGGDWWKKPRGKNLLTGTVSRDFQPLFFFINHLHLCRPLIHMLKYFWILFRIRGDIGFKSLIFPFLRWRLHRGNSFPSEGFTTETISAVKPSPGKPFPRWSFHRRNHTQNVYQISAVFTGETIFCNEGFTTV